VPWIAVRSGAEVGLLSPRESFSQGASLGDFLLTTARLKETVLMFGSRRSFCQLSESNLCCHASVCDVIHRSVMS